VIHSLTNGSEHIPYRNSKLTRILKDSLSTDTSTLIITTCSLDQNDYHETVSHQVRSSRQEIKNKKKLEKEEETPLRRSTSNSRRNSRSPRRSTIRARK
jgi:hypothetical protein